MSTFELKQASDFRINYIILELSNGQSVDLRFVFEELNLFDNMFTPCMSGNIVIKDSVGIFDNLKFDGSEHLYIDIDKGEDSSTSSNDYYFGMAKKFRIYKNSSRINVSMTSQMYTLHFVSPEFLLSEKQKISNVYNGKYSDMIRSILSNNLNVTNTSPTPKTSGINGIIEETSGIHEVYVPTLTPFETLQFLAKRSMSKNNLPEMVFFETKKGYTFASLSSLYNGKSTADVINFNMKNVDNDVITEFYGAKDFKILTQNSLASSIRDGVYSGKFIAFDTLTGTQNKRNFEFHKNLFDSMSHLNDKNKPIIPRLTETTDIGKEFNSRVASFPWAAPRKDSNYIKNSDSETKLVTNIDDTENYVFQRKSIFANLLQRKIQLVMPGNFSLYTGKIVKLDIPKYTMLNESSTTGLDTTISGNYIILCARHIITYQKHETVIQVATDSYM